MSVEHVALYLSPEHGCSYLSGELATNAYVDPRWRLDGRRYGLLLRQGYRRSGRFVYRPVCANCQACQSARVVVGEYQAGRRQRRIMARNQDLSVTVIEPEFREEHFALYQRYLLARHPEGEMDPSDRNAYQAFLSNPWGNTLYYEFRDQDRVVALAVVDVVPDGLSAVYSFFEPELRQRSLGNFAILCQIAEAQRLNLPYVYLGYWIENSRKMGYKADFRPLEIFSDGEWKALP